MTQLGLGLRVGIFRSHHNGSQSVERSGAVDTSVADLRLRHHFGDGLSAGLSVPIGLVRFDPTGAPIQRATGFGDISVLGRYAFVRGGGYKPTLALETELGLPTGQSTLVPPELGAEAPPNILSLGRGAFAARARISYSQFFTRHWALRAWTGAAVPLHANASGFRFGTSVDAGIGASFVATKSLIFAPQVSSTYLGHSENSQNGTLINSGGLWVTGGLIAVWRATDSLSLSASVRSPLYRDVNGEQITETVTTMLQLGFRFGGKDKHDEEDKHDHGEEDKDKHGEEDKDKHDHGEESSGVVSHSGDVKDLAVGGQSFNPEDAAVPGKITIVDFWAKWCGPCKPMTQALEALAAANPEIAVRKVEVPDFNTPVATQHLHSAKGLPIVWLYDATGRRVKTLEQNSPDEVVKAVEALLAM